MKPKRMFALSTNLAPMFTVTLLIIACVLLFVPSLDARYDCAVRGDISLELSSPLQRQGVPAAPSPIAQDGLHKVRVVYFAPADRINRIESIKPMIRRNVEDALAFFARQRALLGFGTKDIEAIRTDDGAVEVLPIVGKQNSVYYQDRSWSASTGEEIDRSSWKGEFNLDSHRSIVLVYVDKKTSHIEGADGLGIPRLPDGGIIWFWVNRTGTPHWTTTAHEMGHALGLEHNFNSPRFIMSYGRKRRDRLSRIAGQFLSASRYFNDFPSSNNENNTSVEIVAPRPLIYDAQTDKTRLTFRVSDADGVSQILFLPETSDGHAITRPSQGAPEVYWNNEGMAHGRHTIDFTVDFFADRPLDEKLSIEKGGDGINPIWQEHGAPVQRHRGRERGVTHPVRIQVIDMEGFVTQQSFVLREISPEARQVRAKGQGLTTWGRVKSER